MRPASIRWPNHANFAAEGQAGAPKLIDCLVHAHIGGRPNIIGVFEQCIRYAKGFPDVWFATKGEIAK
jgi:hypothetical protein